MMKYLLLLGDGMADLPVPELAGKTPLDVADIPHINRLAQNGSVGLVRTIPEGMPKGSDTANMSCMGFDPRKYYSGRSPLEAVSMGVDLLDTDLAVRCNLVTLSAGESFETCRMLDYSSDEIETEEAHELISALDEAFSTYGVRLHPGISYRHCLVIPNAKGGTDVTPPHDIMEQEIGAHLPKGENADLYIALTRLSRDILQNHPVNRERVRRGLNPANTAWFWGEGTRPQLPDFYETYGKKGGVVCAVDLIRGLGLCAGLRTIDVPGATGGIETNFRGKADAALTLFRDDCDFVYLHVEAPDECGHRHEVEGKVRSIERIDREVLAPILDAFENDPSGAGLSVLIMPDHPTPLTLRTHTGDPVPFVLWRSTEKGHAPAPRYSETDADATGYTEEWGFDMVSRLFNTPTL